MVLASTYATLLRQGEDPEKVLAYMKARGHLSLIAQVVRIMERNSAAGAALTVAKEEDVAGAKERFPEADVSVDPRIVGGFLLRRKSRIIDATYRRALVTLYRRSVSGPSHF